MNQNSQVSQVLIVDDDPDITQIMSMGLTKFDTDSVVDIAHSGKEAIAKIKDNFYTLIITDYHMTDMTGLELAENVRELSPGTQVMLMTAYGSDDLQNKVEEALDGYISKPFTIKQIREIVEDALNCTRKDQTLAAPKVDNSDYAVESDKQLKSLQVNTSAQCVLLIDSSGYTVSSVGSTTNLNVDSISALVAANFTASMELANLLGSQESIFKSSFYEGVDYNIYSYDINGQLLLAVIFGASCKPGVVWYYTKQTAAELAELYKDQPTHFNLEDSDMSSAFEFELDNLFDSVEDSSADSVENLLEEFDFEPKEEVIEQSPPPQPQPIVNAKPLTFEQAVAAGLVPQTILQREQTCVV